MSRLLRAGAAAALLVLLAAACASSASAKTTWLCKPGLAKNPCVTGNELARLSPSGQVTGTIHPSTTGEKPVDCFYV